MDEDSGREAAQAGIVAFLEDPATHGAPVERVDTHISRLFLAGERVFKMKRAVRLPYADFSTLARRRHFCERELALNAGAGDLYRRLVAVTRAPGTPHGLALGGEGEAVEWLVEMRRFDRAREFDRLADAGPLERVTVERLAVEIARGHRRAAVVQEAGDAAEIARRIDGIAAAFDGVAAHDDRRERVERWRAAARETARRQAAALDRRAREGAVRRCHGDLHLGNIVLLEDGRPVPFDAIEFDEHLASVDVLHDLAFALADLCLRDRRAEASLLLSTWLAVAGGVTAIGLLPLYVSMRAAVRAMVAMTKGEAAKADRRLDAAQAALAAAPRPRLVAVAGMSGTGKSTLARTLAPALGPLTGAVTLRSDLARKRIAGADPMTRLGPEAYGPRMDALVTRCMMLSAAAVLRAGWPVVLDATFLGAEMRAAAAALAEREGVALEGLWLEAPVETAAARVDRRAHDASDATAEIVARQAAAAGAPAGWHRLDASAGARAVEAAARARLGL